MSRGEGLLQRRVLRLVAKSGDGGVSRRELEDSLCPEGFRSDNLLRALRGLSRAGKVVYKERRFSSTCRVELPPPFVPLTDEEILKLLEQPGSTPAPGGANTPSKRGKASTSGRAWRARRRR